MARVQPYLKIAGIAVSLTTGNVLVNAPGSASQSVRPLDPLGGSQQMQFTLLWEDNVAGGLPRAAVRQLVAGTQEAVRSSDGGYVRLTGYVSRAATSIPVTESAPFSINGFYTFDGETVRVDAKPDSTTLTVTRAQRNTHARVHAVIGLGPVFYDGFGSAIGAEVEYGQTVDGVDESIWFGFITGVTVNLTTVTLTCQDVLAHTRNRYQYPLAAVGTGRFRRKNRAGSSIDFGDLYWRSGIEGDTVGRNGILVSVDTFSSEPFDPGLGGWTHARLYGENDEWVVCELTSVGTETIETTAGPRTFKTYQPDLTSAVPGELGYPDKVVAVGKGDEIIVYTEAVDLIDHLQRVLDGTFRAEYAQVYDDITLADIVGDVLLQYSGDAPPIYGMALPSAWVDSDSIAALNLIVPGTLSNCMQPGKFLMPPMSEESAIEGVAREFLAPLFLSLTTGTNGKVRVVDWAASQVPGTTYGIANAVTTDWQMTTNERVSLPMVWFERGVTTHRVDRSTVTVARQTYIGPRGQTYSGPRDDTYVTVTEQVVKDYFVVVSETTPFDTLTEAPKAIPVNALVDSMDVIVARAQAVVNRYSVGVPTISLSLDSTQDYDVGDLLLVNRGDLPNNTGARAASLLLCIITEAQRNVGLSGAGSRNIRALVVSWNNGSEGWGVWCPCAGVTAWSSPTATVAANLVGVAGPYGTDAAAFAAMLAHAGGSLPVEILDSDLSLRGTGTLTARSGNTLTITTAVAIAADDVIVPADWTSQGAGVQAEPWAFGADAGGVLGTSDPPKTYRGRS